MGIAKRKGHKECVTLLEVRRRRSGGGGGGGGGGGFYRIEW